MAKKSQKKPPKAQASQLPEIPDPKNKDRPLRILVWVSWTLVLLAGFVLSLKSLREPDLWWIFTTGEWIINHLQVPKQDPFSYTMKGSEWINVKWGFEVLASLFEKIGGPSFVYLLQAILTVLSVLFLLKIYQVIKKDCYPEKNQLPDGGFIIALFVGYIAWEFRINGRPEAISHLFMLIYAFWLFKYRQNPGYSIYWLVLFQLLWTNLHEAYGMGIIMLGVFTLACWFDYGLYAKKNIERFNFKPWHLSLTTLAAIPAMAINPRGIPMIWHPWNIYQQLGANKYTTELFNFTHPNYWQFQAYINILLLFLVLVALFQKYQGKTYGSSQWFFRPLENVGTGYLLFLGMFFYLSLTAFRNIPFFVLISLPLAGLALNRGLNFLVRKWTAYPKNPIKWEKMGFAVLIIFGIGFYITITTGTYYKQLDRKDRFGLQVDAVKNPVEVTGFLKKHNVEGRCFADYLTSSYLLWHLRPDFKTFIDLRDLDVFPQDFFNRFAQMVKIPDVFKEADSLYKFDYVVLYRLEFQRLHQYLVKSKEYEPVFADAVAVVYLKKNRGNDELISKYGMNTNQSGIFHKTTPLQPSTASSVINHLAWPFFDASTYGGVNFKALASDYYRSVGKLDLAYKKAKKAVKHPKSAGKGHETLGNVYMAYASKTDQNNKKQQYYRSAIRQFQMALNKNDARVSALVNLGALNLNFGNIDKAQKHLEKAVWLDPGNARAYQFLGKVYRQKAQQGDRRDMLLQRLDYLEKAKRIDSDNLQLTLSLGVGYCELDKCEKATPYLREIKTGSKELDGESQRLFTNCWEKCQ